MLKEMIMIILKVEKGDDNNIYSGNNNSNDNLITK